MISLIARFMGSTWGPSGADRTQVGPMVAPWTAFWDRMQYPNISHLWVISIWYCMQEYYTNISPGWIIIKIYFKQHHKYLYILLIWWLYYWNLYFGQQYWHKLMINNTYACTYARYIDWLNTRLETALELLQSCLNSLICVPVYNSTVKSLI